jgi:hypothetical protein
MLVDAAHRQFEGADAALNAWRPVGESTDNVSYVEDAIIVFLGRPAILRAVVDRLHQTANSKQEVNLLRLWHEGSGLFRRALKVVPPLRDMINIVGAELDDRRKAEFDAAVRELEEMADRFRRTFPIATAADKVVVRAAIEAKEYQDADEAFAEIAGVEIEEWRRRMATPRVERS